MIDFSSFSAKEWIAEKLTSATNLTPDTLNAVENFTLMWHVFEGLLCSAHADMKAFEILAVEIVKRRRRRAELELIFHYYQKRYYEKAGFTEHFAFLRFHSKSQKEFVETVISAKKSDFKSIILTLLIILHRLQKTLFHGLPALDILNSQSFSLDVACHALATIIEAHGRHFKRERYAGQFPG
jgi:hypothetical protein